DTEAGLIPVFESASAWGDYDNDGDLDVVLTGLTEAEDGSFIRAAQLYNNDNGPFISVQTDIMAVSRGSVAWGDYDNDGDLDLVVTGIVNDSRSSICYLYRNDQGDFIQIDHEFPGIADGQAIWGDYDTDGDLDLLIAGDAQTGLSKMHLYRNVPEERNEPPDAPTQLRIPALTAQTVTLCWDPAQDDTTLPQALSYNMRVGTDTQSDNIMPSMSLLQGAQAGQRLVVSDGNVGQRTCAQVKGLMPNTTYFARVQAVDHGFAGSVFSEELTFTTAMRVAVEEAADIPEAVQLDAVYPNPFRTSIEIRYTLAEAAPVSLVIYDVLGREVDRLVELNRLDAGVHSVTWKAGDLASGVYLYRLTAGNTIQTKRMILLK
ncbi:MAG TPA: FG-GAP-like repeat-containing protein, partial [Rhodothermales bacterium]|nr:FG-GAP-like repeat-containing protein [Rhodothermales bacterium]